MIRSQIRRQVAGVETRFKIAPSDVIPLVIRILRANKVVVLRLDSALRVVDGKVYVFREPGGSKQGSIV